MAGLPPPSEEDQQRVLDEADKPRQRKAYTITKQRETWTDEEHQKFREALDLYGREWKLIEQYIGTKTVVQIRSHAQKFFIKLAKSTPDQIPPTRTSKRRLTNGSLEDDSVNSPASPSLNSIPIPTITPQTEGQLVNSTTTTTTASTNVSSASQPNEIVVAVPMESQQGQTQSQPVGLVPILDQNIQTTTTTTQTEGNVIGNQDPNSANTTNPTLTTTTTAAAATTTTTTIPNIVMETKEKKEQQQHLPWSSAPETITLNPYIGNVAAFTEWMISNSLLPPNQTLEQYAEQQQRQQEQLHLAQVFLQQAMGVPNPETDFHPMPITNARPMIQSPADYSRVYSFLCSIFEINAPVSVQLERLNELPVPDRDLALLILHQMAIGIVANQMQDLFNAHLQQYRNSILALQQTQSQQQQQQQPQNQTQQSTQPTQENVTISEEQPQLQLQSNSQLQNPQESLAEQKQ